MSTTTVDVSKGDGGDAQNGQDFEGLVTRPKSENPSTVPFSDSYAASTAAEAVKGSDYPAKGMRKRGTGFHEFWGVTDLERQTMDKLAEKNVKTYADAALRLGCSVEAVKKRMQRVYWRYEQSKRYTNFVEAFQRKRKANRSGKA